MVLSTPRTEKREVHNHITLFYFVYFLKLPYALRTTITCHITEKQSHALKEEKNIKKAIYGY